ncbi:MAG TPA: hypothetical protein DD621_01010 [Clostridiales bacterium]|nr:hypothetical protein [Clostridiales bacterium]
MAEQKKTTSKSSAKTSSTTTTTKRSTTSSSRSSMWGINKISFWVIGAMAILYLVASILAICGLKNPKIISALQGVATAMAICIAAVLAWKYVRNKQTVWKVLYFVLLLVVLLGIVLPLVI